MTPEERLARLERVTKMLANKGRKVRSEWREQSRDQAEKINILIHMQMKVDEQLERTDRQIERVDGQINNLTVQVNSLAAAQAELAKSQKLTDRALRTFINSLRKGGNGNS
jgi:DNA repair exonuclease SbcCD ATPase subunit